MGYEIYQGVFRTVIFSVVTFRDYSEICHLNKCYLTSFIPPFSYTLRTGQSKNKSDQSNTSFKKFNFTNVLLNVLV